MSLVGDMQEQKIFALAMYLKGCLHNSMLKHFTLNRLSVETKVNYRTLKKYLPKLQEREYIHFEGSGKNTVFIVNSLSSHLKARNYEIEILNLDTFRSAVKSIRAFIAMHLQARKEYMRQLLQTYHNPKKCDNFRAVRGKVRRLVRFGYLKSMTQEYTEYGLSLERIRRELGCCIVTAYRTMNYAIGNHWLEKHRHYKQYYAKSVHYMDIPWATFCTKDNIYVVESNTYSLTPIAASCFGLSADGSLTA